MNNNIDPKIINTISIGYGYNKMKEYCPKGFILSENECVQKCPSNVQLNNICRCNKNLDCPYGFKCLNNLCLSTDQECPDNHKLVKDQCIQECKDPKNQNGPVCKCDSSDDCNLGQECNKLLKNCIIQEESLGNVLGISPNYEEQILTRQEMKNKNTYNIFLLVPVVTILFVYYVIMNSSIPMKGFLSELLIIASIVFVNYLRFSKICEKKLPIMPSIRKSIIILGISSILIRILSILPPIKMAFTNMGISVLGWMTSIILLIIFIINNHLDDKLEGENYDCNYILDLNTFKDIKNPLNIVFLVSLFLVIMKIFSSMAY